MNLFLGGDLSLMSIHIAAQKIRTMINHGNVDATSVSSIVKAATSIVNNPWDVVEVIEELAKGADGIEGTRDDLICPSTMAKLRVLLRHDLVEDLASVFAQSMTIWNKIRACFVK